MKEKVGVVYDSSARGVDIVSILVSRLPLSQEHVRPVSDVSVGWLRSYQVLMLVSSYWSDMFLPCEWHKFFTKIGVWTFSGRTVVPVSTSVPLSVSIAPALRRIFAPVCVRIISPVEVFFIPEGHFAEAGNLDGATRQVDEWLTVFCSYGQPADESY